MSAVAVVGTDVLDVLRTLPPVDTRYYLYLVGRAPADGNLWDNAATAARDLDCHPVTISKSRGRLEAVKLLLRTGGGHKGTSVTMTVFRSLRDGFDRLKERALAAIAATRRTRAQAAKARRRGLAKASHTASPLISSKDEEQGPTPIGAASDPTNLDYQELRARMAADIAAGKARYRARFSR